MITIIIAIMIIIIEEVMNIRKMGEARKRLE